MKPSMMPGRRKPKGFASMIVILALALVAACSGDKPDPLKTTQGQVAAAEREVGDRIDQAQKAANVVKPGQIRDHSQAYAGGRAVPLPHGDRIPAGNNHFELNTKGILISLRDIATEVASQSKLPVDVVDDIPGTVMQVQQGNEHPVGGKCKMAPNYKGTLDGFLEVLQTWCDLTWSMHDGRIDLRQYETKSYTLLSEPTAAVVKSAMTSSGMTSSGTGQQSSGLSSAATASTGQALENSLTNSAEMKVWDEVKTVLASVASPGVVQVSPATRTIVVTAKHSAQTTVNTLLLEINRRQLREVVFTVTIIDLTVSQETDLGLSLSAALNSTAGQYLMNAASPPQIPVSNVGSLALTIQNNTVSGKTNSWAGTSGVVNLLSTIGNVASRNTLTLRTLNGRSLPVTVARQLAYLSSSNLASSSTTTTLASQQESTLTIGLTLQLLPVILDDGQVILQYGFGLSALNNLTSLTSNGSTYQEPDINVRGALQEAVVSSGETLVLLGYDQQNGSQNDQGIPGLTQGLLGFVGGSKDAKTQHAALVVVVTPQVKRNEVTGQ